MVSQRVPAGMCLMYHAQEKIVNTPGSEMNGVPGGIHNSVMRTVVFDSETLVRAHELAHARAARLRDEAIDDFWRGADAVIRRGLDRSQRAAQRLLHRLRHHEAGRAAAAPVDA